MEFTGEKLLLLPSYHYRERRRVAELWEELFLNLGKLSDYIEDFAIIRLFGGRLLCNSFAIEEKLQELYPEEAKNLSIKELLQKHYSPEALALAEALFC